MKDFYADLHCHTTCSDGSLTPKEMVLLAKESGLSALAITDHDSINAFNLAEPVAREQNIKLLPGVEFSTMQGDTSIHILGYAFNPSNPLILEFCKKHTIRRKNRNDKILKLLEKANLPITDEELLEETTLSHTIGRPHIAKAMMKKGYVISIQEAFKKYLGDGKSCYAEGASYSTSETIDLIHQAKGLAIIAHPHLVDNAKTLQELLKLDFDGIECYYGKFHQNHSERWLKIATKKNWLVTGGSDFHGTIKPNLPLGASFVNEENFNKLYSHFQKNI